jgi:regulation of enolase protein 1 (concanavalin A-like superfamily)
MNLLADLTPHSLASHSLAWDNPPLDWQPLPGGGIRVTVPARADYFQDPAGRVQVDSAPFLWLPMAGDFTARAHVRPAFDSTYDSGVLMIRHDEHTWAKLCFEKTDFGTTAAVSVVTRGLSDDANGVDLAVPDLWLQACRAGDVIALHYALDGRDWRMVRIFSLPMPPSVKVGIVAQCPVGPGTTVDFLHFSVEAGLPANLRAGK